VDTNKCYLKNYEKYFLPFVNKEIKLLEIGVFKGESLLFWRDYFLKGTIIGLDVNKVDLEDPTGRIHIYQGFQQDLKILDMIGKKAGPNGFDIIIDDASHIGEGRYPLVSRKISEKRRNMLKTKNLLEISPKFCSRENINKNSKIEI